MDKLLLSLLILLVGIIIQAAAYCDNVLFLEAQKKQLNQKFEAWWNSVKHCNRTDFSLLFAKKVNSVLNLTFGPRLVSWRLIMRSSIVSAGMLMTTLAAFALINHEPFGGPPWKAYDESAKAILTVTDFLSAKTNYTSYPVVNFVEVASKINSSTNHMLIHTSTNYIEVWATNGVYVAQRFEKIGNGGLTIFYGRYFNIENRTTLETNDFGLVATNEYALDDFVGQIQEIHREASRFANNKYRTYFSVVFYLLLFFVNSALFVAAMVFARLMLREIAKSGSVVTMFALVFTNAVILFLCSVLVLFLLTTLAIPLFWLLIPYFYSLSHNSLYTVFVFFIGAAFGVFLTVGSSTKALLFIAFFPGTVALFVGVVSFFALKWPNAFYFIVKHIAIRCAEKSPFLVLGLTLSFVCFIVTSLVECIHFLGFL